MVNETDKQESMDNEQLGQRLAASNQALINMNAEQCQLLEEMEQLRKRAESLQLIIDHQEHMEEVIRLECQQNLSREKSLDTNEENNNDNKNFETQKEENNKDNPEDADYIHEKLGEIARLKAQFRRVQQMINTTELIENHFSKNTVAKSGLSKEATGNKPKFQARVPELSVVTNVSCMTDLNSATADEKEKLILAMLNTFQDFSSDLKSQADNLRAERERIRELKESMTRSRKEQSK